MNQIEKICNKYNLKQMTEEKGTKLAKELKKLQDELGKDKFMKEAENFLLKKFNILK